jgi:hypothetical protein
MSQISVHPDISIPRRFEYLQRPESPPMPCIKEEDEIERMASDILQYHEFTQLFIEHNERSFIKKYCVIL